jgi:hypothetical protein
LSLIIATIVLDNFFSLSSFIGLSNREWKLNSNVRSHAWLQIKLLKKLNSNGSWFIDNISCPSSVSMSWALNNWTISTNITKEIDRIYCLWNYNNWTWIKPLKIFFNEDFTDLIEAEYDNNSIWVSAWLWTIDFWDSDHTLIDFTPNAWYLISDNIDDNLNSDNYKANSTWSVNYPNWFEDDDNLARKIIFWYVTPEEWMKKVFWKNTKIANFIAWNSNNTDNLNKNLWTVNVWILYLDIDKAYHIKLDVFDKTKFETTNELKIIQTLTWASTTWKLGFLQNDLSLSETLTANEYLFDFTNNDYWLFLKDTWTWTLLYKLRAEEQTTGSWIYINPIDDSGLNTIKFLWNEIIVDAKNNYLTKQLELIFKK